jgi:hypothetical protein
MARDISGVRGAVKDAGGRRLDGALCNHRSGPKAGRRSARRQTRPSFSSSIIGKLQCDNWQYPMDIPQQPHSITIKMIRFLSKTAPQIISACRVFV